MPIKLPIEPRNPGIYFDLPEQEYHDDPSLSCSGIKKLLEGPEQYWFDSWMNPHRPARETKDCLARGTLWHCRMLEPENFDNKYVRAPFYNEIENGGMEILDTISDMRAWMERNNFHGYKKSGSKAEYIDAVLQAEKIIQCDKKPYIIEYEKDWLIKNNPGKTVIWSRALWEEMLAAEAAILEHEYFSRVFAGGKSEVSIFWVDEQSGIPMKCRIDKLKPTAILDYKTLHVPRGKTVDKAALDSIKFEKYDLQSALYVIAVAQAISMLNDKTGEVYCFGSGAGLGDFLDELKKTPEKPFAFVFQQEERPNAVRGKKVVRQGGELFSVFGNGVFQMQQGIEIWLEYWNRFGVKRWVDPRGIEEIGESEIYYG